MLAAIGHVKHGNAIAQQHRKRSAALPTRLAGLVLSSLNTSGVGFVKSMTDIERHAELMYAETLFEKVKLIPLYLRVASEMCRLSSALRTREIGLRLSRKREFLAFQNLRAGVHLQLSD